MKDIYIILLGIGLIIVLLWILWEIRKCRARKKVRCRKDYQKIYDLNKALDPYGFLFDPTQEIFYSKMNAWQREFGYCKLYDELSPTFHMVMDCEPVTFDYDNRKWLIEFWKGQYGILTGGEIGVYVGDQEKDFSENFTGLFYDAVPDDERLCMRFCLRKKDHKILERKGFHWWLTGFRIGEFSRPQDLIMDWEIMFPNIVMRDAFIDALHRMGYHMYELQVEALVVKGVFAKPHSKQPRRKHKCIVWLVQKINHHNCKVFMRKTRMFRRTLDKLDYIRLCFPLLYRMVLKIGKMKKLGKVKRKMNRKKP